MTDYSNAEQASRPTTQTVVPKERWGQMLRMWDKGVHWRTVTWTEVWVTWNRDRAQVTDLVVGNHRQFLSVGRREVVLLSWPWASSMATLLHPVHLVPCSLCSWASWACSRLRLEHGHEGGPLSFSSVLVHLSLQSSQLSLRCPGPESSACQLTSPSGTSPSGTNSYRLLNSSPRWPFRSQWECHILWQTLPVTACC